MPMSSSSSSSGKHSPSTDSGSGKRRSLSSTMLESDKSALLSLLQSTSDISHPSSSWATDLTGWSSDSNTPICGWDGITCTVTPNGQGRVSSIVLPASGLSGTIPPELGTLSELQVLDLNNNMLRGSIPQTIANLKKLTRLDVTQCFLTGTLPQRFESKQLKSIRIANNAISGKFFNDVTSPHIASLVEVRMENNLLTGELSSDIFQHMTQLTTLSLSDNDLSGLIPGEALGSLGGLKHLYLDANHFVGPLPPTLAQIGKSSIFELWVQDNALSGTVPATYARFDSLHDFYLDGNKLTGALPPSICGPKVNEDFFENVPKDTERNYCDSIACPAGSVALEGMYPCTQCPGGEAARLKNRYLGQQGKCIDHTERDVLRIFHEATTKGGPWSGISDWAHPTKPICDMTGITCDSQGHVIGISLKNRHLQGHIPDSIGLLTFLETLDVSDNSLMGYVPSDLQWTSIKNLDVSGNKIRGLIPPLLCKMEDVNGNGQGSVFHCDRIACPAGTYNSFGYQHGLNGEECLPCFDGSPYIGQKYCTRPTQSNTWKETGEQMSTKVASGIQMAKEATQQMDGTTKVGLGVSIATLLIATLVCWLVKKRVRSRTQQKEINTNEEREVLRRSYIEEDEDESSYSDDPSGSPRRRGHQARSAQMNHQEEQNHSLGSAEDESIGQSIGENSFGGHHEKQDLSKYRASVYRDFEDDQGDDIYEDDNDGNFVSWTQRNATDFVREHQGIAMTKTDRLKQAVAERVPQDLSRRAREAASRINVSSRQTDLNNRRRLLDARMKRNTFS